MEISFNLPINSVSFGQVSLALLREAFNRKLQPSLVPIGEVDLSSQSGLTDEFKSWLDSCLKKGRTEHSREVPCLKLWHLNGGMESVSNKPHLLTFYELDEPTKTEINVARNNKVIFTSSYTKNIFEREGIDCGSTPLGFDLYNFHKINKKSTQSAFKP